MIAAETAELIEYPHVEQRSDEWHDQRRGMVTASVVGQLLTPALKVADNDTSRGLTAALVAERITGYTEPNFVTADMWRGIEEEPRAVAWYAEQYDVTPSETGFMVREWDGLKLGYSPDGLVGDDGLIEVKAPRMKGHLQTILGDRVPERHMAQCQAGLLVSGRDWLDFISWCGGMPPFVKRVRPNLVWFAAITEAVRAFEDNAARMVAQYRQATDGVAAVERIAWGEIEVK